MLFNQTSIAINSNPGRNRDESQDQQKATPGQAGMYDQHRADAAPLPPDDA